MRTTRLTKIAMVIFLSMIFFLGVQRPVLAADRNTTVKIPVEQIFEVNNSADADKTGSYVLIADQIQNPMPEGSNRRTFTWNMSGNSSTELIMNVGQVGEYHYNGMLPVKRTIKIINFCIVSHAMAGDILVCAPWARSNG